MNNNPRIYVIKRYFLSGDNPQVIEDNLTLDEAITKCRAKNQGGPSNGAEARTWIDIAQLKDL